MILSIERGQATEDNEHMVCSQRIFDCEWQTDWVTDLKEFILLFFGACCEFSQTPPRVTDSVILEEW